MKVRNFNYVCKGPFAYSQAQRPGSAPSPSCPPCRCCSFKGQCLDELEEDGRVGWLMALSDDIIIKNSLGSNFLDILCLSRSHAINWADQVVIDQSVKIFEYLKFGQLSAKSQSATCSYFREKSSYI